MSKTLRVVTVLMLIMLLVSVLSITSIAQDEDDIDYVREAMIRLTEQNTFIWTTETSMEMISIVDDTEIVITVMQSGEGLVILKDGEMSALSMFLDTSMDISNIGDIFGDLGFNMDMIFIDDVLYIRIEGAGVIYEEAFGDLMDGEWANVSDLPIDQNEAIMLIINLEGIIAQSFGDAANAYQAEYITELVELDNELFNDQVMRSFIASFDMQALFASDAVANSLDGLGFGDALNEMDGFADSATQETTILIGADDGLPYVIETNSIVETETVEMGQTTTMEMTIVQRSTYSNYNEPFTIEAPEID